MAGEEGEDGLSGRCVLVRLKDLAGLSEVINLFVGLGFEAIEKGLVGFSEYDALAPACGHGEDGDEGEEGREVVTGRRKKGTGGCRLEGMCWIRTLREAVIFAQVRLSPEPPPAPVLAPHGLSLCMCWTMYLVNTDTRILDLKLSVYTQSSSNFKPLPVGGLPGEASVHLLAR